MKRNRRRSRGFTVIEMIVATVVLSIGIASVLAAFNASIRVSGLASEQQTATMLAQKQLAELGTQTQGQVSPGESDGDFAPDYPGYHWKQSVTATDYTYLYQVTVTVTWGPAPQRERTLTTYITTPQTYSPTSSGTTTGAAGG